MDDDTITRQLRKIQVISDLLTSHEDQEYSRLGELLSDVLHPLLQHFTNL